MEAILLNIFLNQRSETPFFEQIANQLRVYILSGQLEPGSQLPTVRHLAQRLKINFNTVARAYRLLEMEGLASTQQGRGTYILSREIQITPEESRQQARDALVQRIAGLIVSSGFALEEITERLSPTPIFPSPSIKKPRKAQVRKVTQLPTRGYRRRVGWFIRYKPMKKQKKRV